MLKDIPYAERWRSNPHRDKAALNFARSLENACSENVNVDTYPWFLMLEPTKNCNLRCPACRPELVPKFENMTLETFRSVIDEVGPYLYFLMPYRSGEALIHKDSLPMLEYAHSHSGAVVAVSTHASIRWSHEEMVRLVHCVDNLQVC